MMTLNGNRLTTAQLKKLTTSRGKDTARGNDGVFIRVTSMWILKHRVEQLSEESQ